MASAGTVTVDFAAETAKFTAELKKVRGELNTLSGQLQTIDKVARVAFRFFTAGALLSFAKSAFQAADAVGDAAERAGLAVESFSRLQFAASQTDVEMSALTSGISKLQVIISKASEGNREAASTLQLFGLQAKQLKNLAVEDQLGEIAEAFKDIRDPADRTRLATEAFGRAAGPQMVPLLAQGREGIRQLTEQADRLGITLSGPTAEALNEMDKAIKRVLATARAAVAGAIGEFALLLSPPDSQEGKLLVQIQTVEGLIRSVEEVQRGERGLQIFRDPEGEANRLADLNAQLATLKEQLRGVRGETAASQLNNLLPLPFLDPLQTIDVAAIQALKINVDELALSFTRLNQSIVEIQQARASEALQLVNDAVVENQRLIEQQITANVQAELDARVAATQRANEFQLQQEAALQQTLKSLRASTFSAAIGALQSFAGHSKKAAIALVAINKAVAISQAIQNTAAAATKAIAVYGPTPAGFAAAAAAKAFGALQIAAIVASGIGEIQQINRSGGAPIGSPSNPAFVNSTNSASDQQFGATSQRATQIVFAGPVFNNRETRQAIVDAIREEVDNEVIVISPNSRNGQELLGAPA